MAEITVESILRQTAEAMRDESRVVRDRWHTYEDEGGNSVSISDACRACVLGHIRIAAKAMAGDEYDLVGNAAKSIACDVWEDFTEASITATEAAVRLDALADEYAKAPA